VDRVCIRRVSSLDGADLISRKPTRDYSGLAIPYFRPGATHPHAWRLRLDNPPLERNSDGTLKETCKYLTAAGRGNSLYFVPDTPREYLHDVSLPAVLTEGEKKTLALERIAWEMTSDAAERPLFLPIGLPGVYAWKGKVGKEPAANGGTVDVHGPIADLDLVQWTGRRVTILFDANAATNPNVAWARYWLARELKGRGAAVLIANIPAEHAQ
jgi:hypothetical protein